MPPPDSLVVGIPLPWMFGLLQLGIAGGVGWIVKAIGDVRTQLRLLNGRMIALETWKIEHDRVDETTREETRDIRAELHQHVLAMHTNGKG